MWGGGDSAVRPHSMGGLGGRGGMDGHTHTHRHTDTQTHTHTHRNTNRNEHANVALVCFLAQACALIAGCEQTIVPGLSILQR